jgi:CheY-like chemotaxis protein
MNLQPLNIIFADDSSDDRFFFKEALTDVPVNTSLTMVNDGHELMEWLKSHIDSLPDVIFMDLNMPRKNGHECLAEIAADNHLKNIPVIAYSTSKDENVVAQIYKEGARYYLQKPNDFNKLAGKIHQVLILVTSSSHIYVPEELFFY